MAREKSLGDRQKEYERILDYRLVPGMPIIIRIDGQAFHSFSRGLDRPFDHVLIQAMANMAQHLCEGIPGAKFAYCQSDEVSILVTTYDRLDTEPFFSNRVVKLASIIASKAVEGFMKYWLAHGKTKKWAAFDTRIFNVPKEDVCNNFIWRQKDWTRNSLQMLARSHFSQKELHGLRRADLHEKLFSEKGVNWAELPTHLKNGVSVYRVPHQVNHETVRWKWEIDWETPVFTQDRKFIERWVYLEDVKA